MGAKKRRGGGATSGGKGKAKAGSGGGEQTFPQALVELMKRRKIKVPAGLAEAPPEAYAQQAPAFVEELAKLDDERLRAHAEKIASYAERRSRRAQAAWDSSPLIAELRRRKLKEPSRPSKVVGAAFSLKKPLREWSDAEILEAAKEWSRRGNG